MKLAWNPFLWRERHPQGVNDINPKIIFFEKLFWKSPKKLMSKYWFHYITLWCPKFVVNILGSIISRMPALIRTCRAETPDLKSNLFLRITLYHMKKARPTHPNEIRSKYLTPPFKRYNTILHNYYQIVFENITPFINIQSVLVQHFYFMLADFLLLLLPLAPVQSDFPARISRPQRCPDMCIVVSACNRVEYFHRY